MQVSRRVELEGWSSLRAADGSTESVLMHRLVAVPSAEGARGLGDRYWAAVAEASRGLVRPRRTENGVELRVLGRGPVLIRMTGPETSVDASAISCRYRIVGGLLARLPAGTLTLAQLSEPPYELRATVAEFVPRLSTGLYEHLQRRIHVAVSRRFFRALLREGHG
jgi:hypothetical protein